MHLNGVSKVSSLDCFLDVKGTRSVENVCEDSGTIILQKNPFGVRDQTIVMVDGASKTATT